jgi:hypothetical protein
MPNPSQGIWKTALALNKTAAQIKFRATAKIDTASLALRQATGVAKTTNADIIGKIIGKSINFII